MGELKHKILPLREKSVANEPYQIIISERQSEISNASKKQKNSKYSI